MFKFHNESGRSMVEMLGTLAIMGLLSIGVISGYTTAMNNHKANEALNDAKRLAMMISSQRMLGQNGTLSESERGNFQFDDTNRDKIVLTIQNIPDGVINKLNKMKEDLQIADIIVNGNNVTFEFSNDLSPRTGSSDDGQGGNQGGQGEAPANYDNDQDACETANYVYCPATKQCLEAGSDCPCPINLSGVDSSCVDESSGTCKLKPAGSACSLDMSNLLYGVPFNGQCNKNGRCLTESKDACEALGEDWIPMWLPSGHCCVSGTSFDAANNFIPTQECCEAETRDGNYTGGGWWIGSECCGGPYKIEGGVTEGCCEAWDGTYFEKDGNGLGYGHSEAICCDSDGNMIGMWGKIEEYELCAQLMNVE